MSKRYGEPVEVWDADGRPVRFAWRGRPYTVLRVLDRWLISREWWQQRGAGAGLPAEHEFWRVEASFEGNVPPATYELRRDTATGSWLLARIWD
ncbi:MAG: nucleotidyltransferase [Actinobacteria bacterium]|nr:nucleotidyltransferase [Actinomycetota bacterium]